jgi:hypothetical protein
MTEKIASPEPIYIKSEYELKRKERIKQSKERLKSLGLDLSIGELAKEINDNDGRKTIKDGKRATVKKQSKRKIPEQTKYNVEKIVAHKVGQNGKYQLLIKWEGYTSDENTWEDANEK